MIAQKNSHNESSSVALFLLSMTFALFASAALYVISSPQLRKFARFQSTLRTVMALYPGEIDGDELFKNSSDAVYASLDRYSRYAPAQAYDQVVEEYSGAYAGLGVTIVSVSNGLLIASVNPDGPALDAGVKLGDVIISANSLDLAGKTTRQASQILRGKEGDSVVVGFIRPREQMTLARNRKGDLSFKLVYDTTFKSIVRAAVPLRHVALFGVTPNNALYLKITDFGAGAFEQFKRALDTLLEARPDNRGIIIDLRNNPGGLLSEALKLADYFLPDNTVMLGKKGRSYWSRREFESWSSDQTEGSPLVIMVNRSSASASEVFSGSLKFNGRATLVGDTTFGKGLIQEYNSLPDGSASKLTVGRYYFAGEHYLNQPGAEKVDSGSGIAPDIYHEFTADGSFIRELRAKMLFTRFVARYQDQIITAFDSDRYSSNRDDIILEFNESASEAGFSFRSELLERASELYMVASLYESDSRPRRLSDSILKKAENLERDVFDSQKDKIMLRLAQLAFERRDGAKSAFLKVILPNDPAIATCENVLLKNNSDISDTTKVGA